MTRIDSLVLTQVTAEAFERARNEARQRFNRAITDGRRQRHLAHQRRQVHSDYTHPDATDYWSATP